MGVAALFALREDTHFYATMALPVVHRVALELGKRLQRTGTLCRPEDVFHLRLEELADAGPSWPPPADVLERLAATAERRRLKRESVESRPFFDPGLLGTPGVHRPPGVLLAGTPGSPGVARGPARIVLDEAGFAALRDGEVLVAPLTNPAWTPLFARAAAVVVDTGGAASHAAIVAREYGVPAVMGTGDGTTKLADGQVVIVDGTRGVVIEEGMA